MALKSAKNKKVAKVKAGESRQRLWQEKVRAEGRCVVCGNPREMYSHRCNKHQALVRKSAGGSTYKPGNRGRVPFSVLKKFTVEKLRDMTPAMLKT